MDKKKLCGGLLYVVDFMFASLVLTPFSMLWWAGTWLLLDQWLFPDDHELSYWISFAIGTVISLSGYLILPLLQPRLTPGWNLKHVVVSRLFVYVYGTGQLAFWRGVWELGDLYLGTDALISGISLVVVELILLVLRGASNNVGLPFFFILDNREDFYHTYPRFRSQLRDGVCQYSVDCAFTLLVMGPCTVLVWRGIWNIAENLILPHDEITSCLICLGVGVFLAIVLHALQQPSYLTAKYLSQKSKWAELAFDDCIFILVTISSLMTWRGGVDLIDDWLAHGGSWGGVGAHLVGAGGMMLCNAGSNMAVVGCSVDGEQGQGEDILWPMDFWTQIVRNNCAGCIEADEVRDDEAEIIWDTDDEVTQSYQPSGVAPYDNGTVIA